MLTFCIIKCEFMTLKAFKNFKNTFPLSWSLRCLILFQTNITNYMLYSVTLKSLFNHRNCKTWNLINSLDDDRRVCSEHAQVTEKPERYCAIMVAFKIKIQTTASVAWCLESVGLNIIFKRFSVHSSSVKSKS